MAKIKKPLVSIIVPVYKQEQYLDDAVRSVMAQTSDQWELIIVNDNSPTWSDKMYELEKRSKRIRIIEHAENLGLSATRNTGIYASQGKYILPLDADDMLATHCVEKMVEAMKKHKDKAIVYCDYLYFGYEQRLMTPPEFDFERLKNGNYIPATAMYPRKEALKAGGYDENMKSGYEDWELWLRLCFKHRLNGVKIPQLMFFYRTKEESMVVEARKNHFETVDYIRNKHKEMYE